MRSARSARSLLDVGAPRSARPSEISLVIIFSTHTPVWRARPVWRTSSSKRSVEGHKPMVSLDPPSSRPGPTVDAAAERRDRSRLFFFFFFSQPKKRRSASCAIGTEIVPHNEFLAFRRMRTADCDSVSATVVPWLPERHDRRPGESPTGSSVLIPRYCAPPFGSCTYTGSKASLSRYLS